MEDTDYFIFDNLVEDKGRTLIEKNLHIIFFSYLNKRGFSWIYRGLKKMGYCLSYPSFRSDLDFFGFAEKEQLFHQYLQSKNIRLNYPIDVTIFKDFYFNFLPSIPASPIIPSNNNISIPKKKTQEIPNSNKIDEPKMIDNQSGNQTDPVIKDVAYYRKQADSNANPDKDILSNFFKKGDKQ